LQDDTFLFAKSIHDHVLRNVPAEKARAVLRQAELARAMELEGVVKSDGLGQKIGSIDSRTFMRWWQEFPGCWNDEGFIKKFLKDNPPCRAAGYRI
jgi:hypothetical protein